MIEQSFCGRGLSTLDCRHTEYQDGIRQVEQDSTRSLVFRKNPKGFFDPASAKDLFSDKARLNAFCTNQCFSAPRTHLKLCRSFLAIFVFQRKSRMNHHFLNNFVNERIPTKTPITSEVILNPYSSCSCIEVIKPRTGMIVPKAPCIMSLI